jgi:hypothetical protein
VRLAYYVRSRTERRLTSFEASTAGVLRVLGLFGGCRVAYPRLVWSDYFGLGMLF